MTERTERTEQVVIRRVSRVERLLIRLLTPDERAAALIRAAHQKYRVLAESSGISDAGEAAGHDPPATT